MAGPYLDRVRQAARSAGVPAALAEVAASLNGRDGPLRPPDGIARPELLGELHQALMARDERRAKGAFYTPGPLAAAVAAETLGPLLAGGRPPGSVRVCDPAVGGGALLLAAARYLIARGARPADAVGNMTGIDIDPVAASTARLALGLLGGTPAIAVGDALAGLRGCGFDAVVTNPPFLGQLKRGTARGLAEAAALVDRFGGTAAGYADSAALFLVLSLELVGDGGRVGIILPEPAFATRDGAPARELVGAASRLVRAWPAPPSTFDAGTRARVVVFEKGPGTDRRTPWATGRWSSLEGLEDGDPLEGLELRTRGSIGDLATTTAGFRDEFYGLAEVTTDVAGGDHPLVTCGLIEPAWLAWGKRPARVARRPLCHPTADVGRLAPGSPVAAWVGRTLVPKVLVATQTRVLEAVADEDGRLVPMVPVIAVMPRPEDLWRVLAALLAPPVSALAVRRHGGAALSSDAIKLSARQVAALPLPADGAAWEAGARAAKRATLASRAGDVAGWRAALDELGVAMCAAYAVPAEPVLGWWAERLERVAGRV